MKEKPILFSAPMVRAILAGIKTQTRRMVKPQPVHSAQSGWWYPRLPIDVYGKVKGKERHYANEHHLREGLPIDFCRYETGSRLWVRETFSKNQEDGEVSYRATYKHPESLTSDEYPAWKPSIFMPRALSRITLEVTGVRVERLHEIDEDDAQAEGVQPMRVGPCQDGMYYRMHHHAFIELWDSINGKRPGASWADNPWVWVLGFKRV